MTICYKKWFRSVLIYFLKIPSVEKLLAIINEPEEEEEEKLIGVGQLDSALRPIQVLPIRLY